MLMNVLFTNPVKTMELAPIAKDLIRVLARTDGLINIVKQVFIKHTSFTNSDGFFYTSNIKLNYCISKKVVVIYNIRLL